MDKFLVRPQLLSASEYLAAHQQPTSRMAPGPSRRVILVAAASLALFVYMISGQTRGSSNSKDDDFSDSTRQAMDSIPLPPDYTIADGETFEKIGNVDYEDQREGHTEQKYYIPDPPNSLDANFSATLIGATCEQIWNNWMAAALTPAPEIPPRGPPADRLAEYTLYGRIPIRPYYLNDKAKPTKMIWDDIDAQMSMTRKEVVGKAHYIGYGDVVYEAMERFQTFIQGKQGAVIGSRNPWVEVFALKHGASSLLTVEYQELDIRTTKNVTYIHPFALAKQWARYSEAFDFIASFSSIEHSGLGRYGDPLDPWGDLREVAKVRCLLKTGGIFILGLPLDVDTLYWNAHRMYGTVRLPWILKGFKMLGTVYTEDNENKESIFVPGIPLNFVLDGPDPQSWLKQQPALILQKV